MSTGAIDAISAQLAAPIPTTDSGPSDVLDKDDFLMLLVTQMQQQDPLNPQDPTEFMSQMTELSSLEQQINMNDALVDLADLQTLSAQLSSASLAGKTVDVVGDKIRVAGGAADSANFDLAYDADRVSIEIYNAAGNIVRVLDMGSMTGGSHTLNWDGCNSDGTSVDDGTYTYEVVAADVNGDQISVTTMTTGRVDTIRFVNGQTLLTIGGEDYLLQDVIGIGA